MIIFCLICKSYRRDGKWQTAQLACAKCTGFLFFRSHSWLLNSLVKKRPAAVVCGCWGDEGCRACVYNSRYEEIYTHMVAASCCVLSGIVSAAGAAPRLCTLTNTCARATTRAQRRPEKVQEEDNNLCCFTACLLSLLHPLFLSFCLSPAVTRSNP